MVHKVWISPDGPFHILRDVIKIFFFLTLKIEFVVEYSVDPDEMPLV